MKPYKIVIDSNSDLPLNYVTSNNIPFVSLTFNYKDHIYVDDFGQTISHKNFYDEVRSGELPTTSQVNTYVFEELFRKHLSEGYDIIYIAFSSALSGTHNSAVMARNTLIEEFPDAKITVIDSKAASMGEGLIVYYAYTLMKNSAAYDEVVNWVETNKLKVNHWFTVDDLNHLKRGGRVSAASAAIGTLLDIKPILLVNDEGRLAPVTKVKGRKKSIKALFEKLSEKIVDAENQVIGISHGDCLAEAEFLAELIKKQFNVKDILISPIGPGVGTHSGPGTLALFFIGENRNI